MLTVMGTTSEPNFLKFQDYCCRAYNILRQNAALLTTLFILVTTEFSNSRPQQQDSPHTTHDRCDHAVYRFGCEQMKPAGMPELSDLSDIQYMRERLNLHVSSSNAVVSPLVCGGLSLTLQHPFHRSHGPHTQMTEEQAAAAFRTEIVNSLNTLSRLTDNYMHLHKHGKN